MKVVKSYKVKDIFDPKFSRNSDYLYRNLFMVRANNKDGSYYATFDLPKEKKKAWYRLSFNPFDVDNFGKFVLIKDFNPTINSDHPEYIIDLNISGNFKLDCERNQQMLLDIYFGRDGEDPLTVKQAGEKYNLTPCRIYQLRNMYMNACSIFISHFFTGLGTVVDYTMENIEFFFKNWMFICQCVYGAFLNRKERRHIIKWAYDNHLYTRDSINEWFSNKTTVEAFKYIYPGRFKNDVLINSIEMLKSHLLLDFIVEMDRDNYFSTWWIRCYRE